MDREQPLQPWQRSHSRWIRSEVAYGPWGRILASLVVSIPLWWFLSPYGIFGAVAGVPILVFVVLPWAYRDIWRRVPVTRDSDRLEAEYRRTAPVEGEPRTDISTRTPPKRW